MGWIIGAIVVLWLGTILIQAGLRFIAALFDGGAKTIYGSILGTRNAAKAFVARGGLGALLFDNENGVTQFVVMSVVCTLVAMLLGGSWILSTIDSLGDPWSPFIGWAVVGMFAGAAISFASRVPALRALRWAHLIGLVPDLEALHAGERAANNIRKVRNRLGIGAGIILLVIIGVSYLAGNIERDRALESGKALTTSIDDMLHGAVRILESGQREDKEERMRAALGTLRRLRVIAESADGRPVPGAGTAAGHYLQKYKDDTEAFVQTADGRAWARANAYSGIDAAQTALWLGRLAERGVAGNQPELSKAYEYFEQAQVAGNPNAPAALQRVAEKLVASKSAEERARGYKFFQIKADEGDPSGWLWLGRRYLKGDGVDKDVPAGALTLMKALNQSSNVPVALRAFADLGTIDRAQADVWRALDNKAAEFAGMKDAAAKAAGYAYLEKRAAEGDPGAQLWTGYRYTEGDGVAADIYAARYWLRKAASQTSDAQVRKRALALLRVANPSAR